MTYTSVVMYTTVAMTYTTVAKTYTIVAIDDLHVCGDVHQHGDELKYDDRSMHYNIYIDILSYQSDTLIIRISR